MKACVAQKRKDPTSTWNCREWLRETPNPKALPDRPRKRKA
jgi:hypothetical protein